MTRQTGKADRGSADALRGAGRGTPAPSASSPARDWLAAGGARRRCRVVASAGRGIRSPWPEGLRTEPIQLSRSAGAGSPPERGPGGSPLGTAGAGPAGRRGARGRRAPGAAGRDNGGDPPAGLARPRAEPSRRGEAPLCSRPIRPLPRQTDGRPGCPGPERATGTRGGDPPAQTQDRVRSAGASGNGGGMPPAAPAPLRPRTPAPQNAKDRPGSRRDGLPHCRHLPTRIPEATPT